MTILNCTITSGGCGFIGYTSEFTPVNDTVSEAEVGEEDIFVCPKCGGTYPVPITEKISSPEYNTPKKEKNVTDIKPVLQEEKQASAGKFRLLVLIDSEQYQIGEDQNSVADAQKLFIDSGKDTTYQIYDDQGKPQIKF